MLSQQLTTIGNSDVAKAAKPASSDAAGSDSENLERSLQSAALESAAPMLSQQLTTLGNSDVAKAAKPASSDAAGSDSENLERSLQRMRQFLGEAEEFFKKQKKPYRADGSGRNAQSKQHEQDLNWISACGACKASSRKCDEGRPCHRCIHLGIEDQVNPLPGCDRNVCDLRPLPPSA